MVLLTLYSADLARPKRLGTQTANEQIVSLVKSQLLLGTENINNFIASQESLKLGEVENIVCTGK